jgi:oligopeptide/dipeptide ABC transporter ATP-binding protein
MYAGRIVELAPRDALFDAPRHPYTRLLLASIPRLGQGKRLRD